MSLVQAVLQPIGIAALGREQPAPTRGSTALTATHGPAELACKWEEQVTRRQPLRNLIPRVCRAGGGGEGYETPSKIEMQFVSFSKETELAQSFALQKYDFSARWVQDAHLRHSSFCLLLTTVLLPPPTLLAFLKH